MRIISVMSDIALMNMRYFLSPPLYFRPKTGFLLRVFRYYAVALSFPATYVPLFFNSCIFPKKSGGKSPSLFHKGIFALISAYYLLAFVIFLNIQVDF